uniref:BTB domain-containing protein n=1 Tax=Oryza punctata TaxID=4537 RepID=A0A0E0LQW0_ORYPU
MALRTISTCTTETAKGIHRFEIFSYSLMNVEADEDAIRSGVFNVGGFDWALLYYPDGIDDDSKGYIGVYLELISKNGEPWALVDVNLINQLQSGQPRQLFTKSDVPTPFRALCETETRSALCEIEVPSMEISSDFAKMLKDGVGADVTFKVGEDTFRAHRAVLAARSPVFHAQLCGPMKEKEITQMQEITIQDMQPSAFEAFLYFI